jgi:hypothetical protein
MLEDKYEIFDKDGKYGVIESATDTVIIPPQYDNVRLSEDDDYIIVDRGDKQGVLDIAGNVVLPIEYYYISSLGNGLFSFDIEDEDEPGESKIGLMDKNKKVLLAPKKEYTYMDYDHITGCIYVYEKHNEYQPEADSKETKGLYDYRKKRWKIKTGLFQNLDFFAPNAAVAYGHFYTLVNSNGVDIIGEKFHDMYSLSNGMVYAKTHRYDTQVTSLYTAKGDQIVLGHDLSRNINYFHVTSERELEYQTLSGDNRVFDLSTAQIIERGVDKIESARCSEEEGHEQAPKLIKASLKNKLYLILSDFTASIADRYIGPVIDYIEGFYKKEYFIMHILLLSSFGALLFGIVIYIFIILKNILFGNEIALLSNIPASLGYGYIVVLYQVMLATFDIMKPDAIPEYKNNILLRRILYFFTAFSFIYIANKTLQLLAQIINQATGW